MEAEGSEEAEMARPGFLSSFNFINPAWEKLKRRKKQRLNSSNASF